MLHASLSGRQVRELLLVLVLSLGTAMLPPRTHADSGDELARAASLSREGRHEAAARIYEQQARHWFRDWDVRPALLAAREYLAAGDMTGAERVLAKTGRPVREDDIVLYGRVSAELALAKNDGPAALAALAAIPGPWPAPLAAELLLLQARADFLAGRTLDGIRAFEERGQLLGAADARAENDRLLVAELQHGAAAAAVPPAATDSERAWIELAQLLTTPADGEAAAAQRAAAWRMRHPNHRGSELLPRATETSFGGKAITLVPAQRGAPVALLLPLSGRQRQAGVAVRDGYVAATLARPEAAPRLLIYDTEGLGPVLAYRNALADGAGLVVGPLTREDVAQLVAAGPVPIPTLALNAPAGGDSRPAFLFEFTLDPEQEARAAARRIAADGHTRGVALFPRSQWGERLYAAFTAELRETGVELTSAQYYEPGARDVSGPLRAALGRYAGAGDRSDGRPLRRRDPAAEARDGPQFAFIAASAASARVVVPQLRFQMTYTLPVYATSDAWDPGTRAAPDLDGLVYPEFPWVLRDGQGATLLWDVLQHEWAGEAHGRLRLYAFGHDAALVASAIASGRTVESIDGLTGQLTLEGDGKVQRSLDWAQIAGGRPQDAGTVATQLSGDR